MVDEAGFPAGCHRMRGVGCRLADCSIVTPLGNRPLRSGMSKASALERGGALILFTVTQILYRVRLYFMACYGKLSVKEGVTDA